MHFHCLATDYDGTLATDGRVSEPTIDALVRLRATGRNLVLVTGRLVADLEEVFPHLDLFDQIVAENGAVIYRPEDRSERVLHDAPAAFFIEALRAKGVEPLSLGHVIVATWHPHEAAVLDAIQELGLELQVIFNKGAVMVLPSGANKATGLAAAMAELGLSARNVVGVGDAENDHAFLAACELSFAVDNALEALKDRCDVVLAHDHGDGVHELIERVLEDDLASVIGSVDRLLIPLGHREDDSPIGVRPGDNLLIAGPSSSGKSRIVTAFLEDVGRRGYQFSVIDPEGDYEELEGAVSFGDANAPPDVEAVMELLADPTSNAVVNLFGVPLEERPDVVEWLLLRLQELRVRAGRPHWIVIDEAHHGLQEEQGRATRALPKEMHGMVFITVLPEHVARELLREVRLLVATADVRSTIEEFARALGESPSWLAEAEFRGDAMQVDPSRR
jgi:HAD superfamily hydrolase (TIGR01484 family)